MTFYKIEIVKLFTPKIILIKLFKFKMFNFQQSNTGAKFKINLFLLTKDF